jgi:hypothetical protein
MYTDVYTVLSTAMYRGYLIGANLTLIPPELAVVLQVLRQITRNFRYLHRRKGIPKTVQTICQTQPLICVTCMATMAAGRYIDNGKGTGESSPTDYQPEGQHL